MRASEVLDIAKIKQVQEAEIQNYLNSKGGRQEQQARKIATYLKDPSLKKYLIITAVNKLSLKLFWPEIHQIFYLLVDPFQKKRIDAELYAVKKLRYFLVNRILLEKEKQKLTSLENLKNNIIQIIAYDLSVVGIDLYKYQTRTEKKTIKKTKFGIFKTKQEIEQEKITRDMKPIKEIVAELKKGIVSMRI